MIAREVSTKARRRSIERAPRTVVAMVEPIAASETATTASAISTSINVNPAFAAGRLELVERDNLDPSGEPVDADLITDTQP
jgi:hypothetical protein